MDEQTFAFGKFCWNELSTQKPQEAKHFYREVFGWQINEPDPQNYMTFKVGEQEIGGIWQMDCAGPAQWTPYVYVADVDSCLQRAEDLGGKVLMPAVDTPYGRIAKIQDPSGAAISLIKF